ncbi:MAG: hypothetical protein E6G33_09380 [Actinobacteria bacterium]|nr:MAG: hypothetical protein E6G33_09380 [Actinomycetota bacterium]
MLVRVLTALALAAVLAVPAGAPAQTQPSAGAFVRRSGSHLTLGGRVFRFGGANVEWLGLIGYGPADPAGPRYPNHYEINDALATALELGARVVRSQTMGDSVGCFVCIEPELGKFNAAAFEPIDYAIVSARRNGIRLIPTIVGDDASAGGSGCVYLRWRNIAVPDCSLVNMAPFWTDGTVRADVEQHIDVVLNHVNRYTGVAYKNEPTILGWDLLNGGGSPRPWTRAIVQHLRRVDSRHLVFSSAWNATLPGVDVCVTFLYPHWQQPLSSRQNELQACKSARKPFVAYEYGWDRTNYPTLGSFRRLLRTLAKNPGIAGDAFWALQAHQRGHGWMPIPADTTDRAAAASLRPSGRVRPSVNVSNYAREHGEGHGRAGPGDSYAQLRDDWTAPAAARGAATSDHHVRRRGTSVLAGLGGCQELQRRTRAVSARPLGHRVRPLCHRCERRLRSDEHRLVPRGAVQPR